MATLLKKQAMEQQGQVTVLNTLAEELKNWKTAKMSKSGLSLVLFDGENNMVSLVLSKNLRKALGNQEFSTEQMGHCVIMEGQNADGEARYYLGLPAEYNTATSVEELLKVVTAKAVEPKSIAKSFTITAEQLKGVGAL